MLQGQQVQMRCDSINVERVENDSCRTDVHLTYIDSVQGKDQLSEQTLGYWQSEGIRGKATRTVTGGHAAQDATLLASIASHWCWLDHTRPLGIRTE